MKYTINGNDICLYQKDFNLDQTLDCGQAFRWSKISDNTYQGFFLNTSLTISQLNEDTILFKDTSESDFLNIWYDYFDLGTDYSELKTLFSQDTTLKKACEYAQGIRLLKQDKWETLCSFIISQNNNIPRIKAIIKRLTEHYGNFPTPEELSAETVESLEYLRSGFRAKYLLDASQKVLDGTVNLEEVAKMPIEDARKTLILIKGVGIKVAECTLLFGMYRTESFPIDVWIRRVLGAYYPDGFPAFTKQYAGIAQQYLFHYIRTANIEF